MGREQHSRAQDLAKEELAKFREARFSNNTSNIVQSHAILCCQYVRSVKDMNDREIREHDSASPSQLSLTYHSSYHAYKSYKHILSEF